MQVIVTGAAGFIGSQVAEALLTRGDSVTGLDNFDPSTDAARKHGNVARLKRHGGFSFLEGDTRDPSLGELLPPRFDAVIHLAALAGVRESAQRPTVYADVNVTGTANVLDVARRRNVQRFVFASSASVYGENAGRPSGEDSQTTRPLSCYGATKLAGEALCHSFHHLYGTDLSVLRFFSVYGPGQRPDMAIARFTRQMTQGQPIHVAGDGSTRRDFTFIADIVGGVLAALDRCSGFHVYNLGSGRPVALSTVIQLLTSQLGVDPRMMREPLSALDAAMTWADVSLARQELGYEPKVGIEEGVRLFVESIRA